MDKNKKYEKAFTLIELLVVIAIIALLASIVLVALGSARLKGRMAQRIANLHQIAAALELYNSDNGGYPVAVSYRGNCPNWGSVGANNTIPGLVPTYMSTFPQDPLVSGNTNCYLYYSPTLTTYKVVIYNLTDVSAATIASQYPAFFDPQRDGGNGQCGSPEATPTVSIWTTGATCY